MRHQIRRILHKVTRTESSFVVVDNSTVLSGSASPGSRLSTDPPLLHISLNLAVLWWSSC